MLNKDVFCVSHPNMLYFITQQSTLHQNPREEADLLKEYRFGAREVMHLIDLHCILQRDLQLHSALAKM